MKQRNPARVQCPKPQKGPTQKNSRENMIVSSRLLSLSLSCVSRRWKVPKPKPVTLSVVCSYLLTPPTPKPWFHALAGAPDCSTTSGAWLCATASPQEA